MGDYTRLCISATLDKSKMHENDIEMFHGLFSRDSQYDDLNTFTKCGRWRGIFGCDSTYHAGCSAYDIIEESYNNTISFTIVCSLKNYEGEIEKFLLMIDGWLYDMYDGALLGYIDRYDGVISLIAQQKDNIEIWESTNFYDRV